MRVPEGTKATGYWGGVGGWRLAGWAERVRDLLITTRSWE